MSVRHDDNCTVRYRNEILVGQQIFSRGGNVGWWKSPSGCRYLVKASSEPNCWYAICREINLKLILPLLEEV